ncbi:MAG: exodeoxyribonuclease VII large subunit [Hespellia sp.]|nr:exodeoxyribonuclease VII large subunit [Hespellia sp.]
MRNVYSVKQVNAYIKNMFTQDYMLSRIYVKGEVSNCKYHSSGHIYFSLKDESGTIACIMFAGQRSGLSFRMREGQQVIVLGNVTTYERDGKYQLYAREIILDGAGLLYERFEALKKELEEMGMFAPEYKQPIPRFVSRVGIVTAPTGAAVRDIIQIAGRRNPYVQLVLYPALVQGDGAVSSIVRGIQMLDERKMDVIIVGRGGGSMEDLWAFNEEAVARAIFECRTPIISAVGHETDTTIADFVADLRAPTPSAAAELAVYQYRDLQQQMFSYQTGLQNLMQQKLEAVRGRVGQMEMKLGYLHPQQRLNENRQYSVQLEERIKKQMQQILLQKRHLLELYIEKMKGLSPLAKLNQGFSYVQSGDGRTVKSTEDVVAGDTVTIFVTDGQIEANVISVKKEAGHGRE